MCKAVVNGSVETVQLLVQAGADLDKLNTFGKTPLYMAAMCGHPATEWWLVGNKGIYCRGIWGVYSPEFPTNHRSGYSGDSAGGTCRREQGGQRWAHTLAAGGQTRGPTDDAASAESSGG